MVYFLGNQGKRTGKPPRTVASLTIKNGGTVATDDAQSPYPFATLACSPAEPVVQPSGAGESISGPRRTGDGASRSPRDGETWLHQQQGTTGHGSFAARGVLCLQQTSAAPLHGGYLVIPAPLRYWHRSTARAEMTRAVRYLWLQQRSLEVGTGWTDDQPCLNAPRFRCVPLITRWENNAQKNVARSTANAETSLTVREPRSAQAKSADVQRSANGGNLKRARRRSENQHAEPNQIVSELFARESAICDWGWLRQNTPQVQVEARLDGQD